MSYSCPSSINALMVRLTRLNPCGFPVDPLTPNSRVTFAAFAKLSLKPDMEKGADIKDKNAAGQIVIRDRDRGRLMGFETTLTLLGAPLPAISMLLQPTLLAGTTPGNYKGAVLQDSWSAPLNYPIMLEVWAQNQNITTIADLSAGCALYTKYVCPLTKSWEVSGNVDFEYGKSTVIELSGYAQKNPNWFPSYPGTLFPKWVPGGGDPAGTPSGTAGPVLPVSVTADDWTLADQTAIRAAGPLVWSDADVLPTVSDCAFDDSSAS